jgi:Transposase
MARTLRRWRDQILAWHRTGASNGPTEGLNSLIKKIPVLQWGPPLGADALFTVGDRAGV